MSVNVHHEHGKKCPLCDWKLREAHPMMAEWFHRVKERYENVHVAWAYRNQAEQLKMYQTGKSKAIWPQSMHNKMVDGKPRAEALDLFLLDEDGNARWPKIFYGKIAAEAKKNGDAISWAGEWTSFIETCHFELKEIKEDEKIR